MSKPTLVDICYLKMKDILSFIDFSPGFLDLKISNFFGKDFFDREKLLCNYFQLTDS